MVKEELVSVVIPAYNSAEFIRQCIESVLAQTYRVVEVVVLDDGSTDNTASICEEFGSSVNLFRQENSGRGSARNMGVSKANGKYLAFLDHDDLLLPHSIHDRVEFLKKHLEVGWVFSDAVEFDDSGNLRLFLGQFPWLNLNEDIFIQLLRGCFPLTSTVMIRRSVMDFVGGFNTSLNYGEDLELFLRLALISNVGMIKEPLTKRRIHFGQGISSNFDRWNSRVMIYASFKASVGAMSHDQQVALKRALKYAYFKLGEHYWGILNLREGKGCFWRSLCFDRWLGHALFYCLLSCGPVSFVHHLRTLKKRVFGFPGK